MKDTLLNLILGIRINDIFDILITTFIIYKFIGLIRETRAQQLVKGLLLIFAAYFISGFFDLNTINWILKGAFTFGVFALVVIFQPEIRRALEIMGRSRLGVNRIRQVDVDQAKHAVDEITRIVGDFAETRTGALMVFEKEIGLEDIAETGTILNADVSAQLLGNIFYEGAPLHDGACIIRGDQVYAAGCVLPLTDNKYLNKSLGTRHRAGIGISEKSDALVLIVSEETGIISAAEDGRLRRYLDRKAVEKMLLDIYITPEDESGSFRFNRLLERIGLEGKKEKNHAEH